MVESISIAIISGFLGGIAKVLGEAFVKKIPKIAKKINNRLRKESNYIRNSNDIKEIIDSEISGETNIPIEQVSKLYTLEELDAELGQSGNNIKYYSKEDLRKVLSPDSSIEDVQKIYGRHDEITALRFLDELYKEDKKKKKK